MIWEHESEFKVELDRGSNKGTRASIERAAELAIADHKTCYKAVAALVERQYLKAQGRERVHVLYVVSKILRDAHKQLKGSHRYGERFAAVLPKMLAEAGRLPFDERERVRKLLRLWDQEGVLPRLSLARILAELSGDMEQPGRGVARPRGAHSKHSKQERQESHDGFTPPPAADPTAPRDASWEGHKPSPGTDTSSHQLTHAGAGCTVGAAASSASGQAPDLYDPFSCADSSGESGMTQQQQQRQQQARTGGSTGAGPGASALMLPPLPPSTGGRPSPRPPQDSQERQQPAAGAARGALADTQAGDAMDMQLDGERRDGAPAPRRRFGSSVRGRGFTFVREVTPGGGEGVVSGGGSEGAAPEAAGGAAPVGADAMQVESAGLVRAAGDASVVPAGEVGADVGAVGSAQGDGSGGAGCCVTGAAVAGGGRGGWPQQASSAPPPAAAGQAPAGEPAAADRQQPATSPRAVVTSSPMSLPGPPHTRCTLPAVDMCHEGGAAQHPAAAAPSLPHAPAKEAPPPPPLAQPAPPPPPPPPPPPAASSEDDDDILREVLSNPLVDLGADDDTDIYAIFRM